MGWIFRKKKPANPMRVAICVGHSRWIGERRDGGAVSVGGVSEWDYNQDLAGMLKSILSSSGHDVIVLDDYGRRGYSSAAIFASERVEAFGGDVCLELHFNAAHGNARGHEWLFERGDDRSMLLAASFELAFNENFPELKNRFVKPITKGERGARFLELAPCPAVICEPFFGSNKSDWDIAVSRKREIALAYAAALTNWWKVDRKQA